MRINSNFVLSLPADNRYPALSKQRSEQLGYAKYIRTGLRQLAMNKSLICIKNLHFICQNGDSQTGVYVPLGVHLGFSRGTILCEKISLFKLNSLSGSNNRLKCLEFLNPVHCNYVKQLRGKTFLQITVILGLNGENLWLLKREEFSFFRDHLDFGHEWGKFVSDSK